MIGALQVVTATAPSAGMPSDFRIRACIKIPVTFRNTDKVSEARSEILIWRIL
jgi:hypothetical protein